mgnify:CR=1 FL=1
MLIKYKKLFYLLSLVAVALSIFSLLNNGLNLGIDFTGGSLLEVEGKVLRENSPEDLNLMVQPGESSAMIRFQETDEATHDRILESTGKKVLRFDAIGPVVGNELKSKSLWAGAIVIVLIILYVAWAFRKIKNPFKYGLLAILALVHDVIITIGVFSWLNIELNVTFVVAILTILGYSVNDTIVVFDRVRENLLKNPDEELAEIVGKSIKETMRRSFFTSLTTLIILFSIYFLGSATIQSFILALIIGIISGTYSSIFLASPLLVSLRKRKI